MTGIVGACSFIRDDILWEAAPFVASPLTGNCLCE